MQAGLQQPMPTHSNAVNRAPRFRLEKKMGNKIRSLLASFIGYIPIALLLGSTLAHGAEKPDVSPNDIPGVKKVDAEEVIKLVEKLPKLIVIDARIAGDRQQGFIEDSISLPDVETDCTALARIAPNKTTPLLLYCNGPKCGRSAKSAQKALACGYSRLYWFRGGFEEWRAKDYPVVKNQ